MRIFGRHKTEKGTVSVTIELGEPAEGEVPPPSVLSGDGERIGNPVSADWMAAPTLAESGGQQPLAGTSHYQKAIDRYAGPRRPDGPTNGLVMAQLVEVTTGEYAGSVAVFVGGDRVGSLRHGLAEGYRPVLAALTAKGLPATCRASIYGGHYGTDPEGWRNYGVSLYQPSHPKQAREGAPFLPPGAGSQVKLADGMAERLDAGLNSQAKRKVGRTVGQIEPGDWTVTLDGEVIGVLEPYAGGDGYLRLIKSAAEVGWALTCSVRIIREPDRPLRVMADIPAPAIV